MSQTFIYPFDPTGTKTTNAVSNEAHTLSPPAWSDFYFIVPKFGPYFRDSLRVVHRPSGRPMVEGIDYHCTHWFHAASHGVGRRVYGSITFLDKLLTGVAEINYQTIGGDWVIGTGAALENITNSAYNPRITTWESVVDLPFQFPVIDHQWNLEDLKGTEDIVEAINAINLAIQTANEANGTGHLGDFLNPHRVTKTQIGLGNVQDYGIATVDDARGGVVNNKYMTPLRVITLMDALVWPIINDHHSDVDNPHGTTKVQIGLGNVLNYGTASNAQARVGTAVDLYMTPLATKEAIDQFSGAVITAHLNNTSNPHGVTKTQVGLGQVANYAPSSQADALAGSSDSSYMTPLRTAQMIALQITGPIDDHVNSYTNPHGVTKTQVGLGSVENLPLATNLQAKTGSNNATYMTPLRVNEAITELAITEINAHRESLNNPHQVTKLQVGLGDVQNYEVASTVEAEAGTATNRYMTPLRVKEAISFQVISTISSHTGSTLNPHGVTKTQVGLSAVENYGIASFDDVDNPVRNDVYMTPLRTSQMMAAQVEGPVGDHLTNFSNPHQVTPAQLGVYTITATDQLLAGYTPVGTTADDSNLLGGVSLEQLLIMVENTTVVNSGKLENKTLTEIMADVALLTAPDSDLLNGKALTEIMFDVGALVAHSTRSLSVTADFIGDVGIDVWTCLGQYDLINGVFIDASLYVEGGDLSTAPYSTSRVIKFDIGLNDPFIYHLDSETHDGTYYHRTTTENVEIWLKTTGIRNAVVVNVMSGKEFFNPLPVELFEVYIAPSDLIEIPVKPNVWMESMLNQLDTAFVGADALFV